MTRHRLKARGKARELGSFQTPYPLAKHVVDLVMRSGFKPRSVFEPTCGRGAFVFAALDRISAVQELLAVEIDPDQLDELCANVPGTYRDVNAEIVQADIFDFDWSKSLTGLPEPILIIGNPPWVTNSEIGAINGTNLPQKSNFKRETGIEAMTGRGNFDISEWVMMEAIKHMAGKDAMLAMLCKTSVARKLLAYVWQDRQPITNCAIYRIDAKQHFGVNVDACLFLARSGTGSEDICEVFDDLDALAPSEAIGHRDGEIVRDIRQYERVKGIRASIPGSPWRSGIKHDCRNVMELTHRNGTYYNNRDEAVELEDDYIYRLYKCSDVANFAERPRERFVIVTQQRVSDDTAPIATTAPKTWGYLNANLGAFNARRSVVYQGRPPFSMFGVGHYAFATWKVAISGLHKRIRFVAIPPHNGKPSMVDDTVYFLPCQEQAQAEFLSSVLNSDLAVDFLSAMVFWDEKRPITARLLKKLDILQLIQTLGLEPEASRSGVNRILRGAQPQLTMH